MKELFDLLETGERKILVSLCAVLAAVLIFHQGIAIKQRRAYGQSVETISAQQKVYERLEESNRKIKMEWLLWEEAKKDIAAIQKDYFYKENESINELRLDLRKIIRTAKIRVISDMIFDWADWEEKELKRVGVQFAMAGSYVALKKFIHQVEIHPKFLMIERINFRDIDTQSGQIELQIELAGYYAN
jgi:cell division protein FtsB